MKKYLPIIAVIALWVVFSSPYIFKGLVPFPSRFLVSFFAPWSASNGMPVKNNAMPDVITQIYPWKMLSIDAWKHGSIPLWNPYSFGGTHLAGNYQSAVFFPFNALFLIPSFIDAWSLFVLFQPLCAALFMFLFLRSLKISPWGTFVGSVAYGFSSYMVTWMAYGTIGYSIAFLPLILWGIASRFSGKPWWYSMSIPLGIFASLTAGHFQMSVYVLITAFLFTLAYGWYTKNYLRMVEIFLLFFTGILLASPQIVLGYDAFLSSNRGQFVEVRELIPWQYVFSFFAPDFFGNPVTRNDWFGHYAEWNGFVGMATMMLALTSACIAKRRMKMFFFLLFLTSLIFSYDTPISRAVYLFKIPFFSTSAASRFIAIGSFSLTVLAALGFDALFIHTDQKKKRALFIISSALLIPVIGLCITAYFRIGLSPEASLIAKRNSILPMIMGIGAISSIIGTMILPKKLKILPAILICVLISFDGYRFATKWMPFDERVFVYPPVKMTIFLRERIGFDRVFGNLGGEYTMTSTLPSIEGYDAMYIGRFGQFIGSASRGIVNEGERSVVQIDKHGIYTPKILQLMGVRYIIQKISDGRNSWAFPYWEYGERMKSIYRDEHFEIFEYGDALPRVMLMSSYQIKRDDQEIIDTLFANEFDIKSTAVLEKQPEQDPQPGDGNAIIKEYGYNTVRITSDSTVPKVLLLSDVWAPGWKVRIDGQNKELLRVNFIFRGVSVPAGSHDIVFYYQPLAFSVALIISGMTGISLFVTLLVAYNKKRT